MTALTEIKHAGIGWLDIIADRPGGADRFNTTRSGLLTALGFYFVLVLFTIFVQGVSLGFPAYEQVILGLAVNALPLFGIALVIVLTVHVLRLDVPTNAVLVPAIYAMSFVLVVGLPLSLVAGNLFSNAMLGALGYMFYRLARYIAAVGIGTSIAYALLSIVVLVALPIGLYMVSMPPVPAS